jgi:anti-sigma B factor antagonist
MTLPCSSCSIANHDKIHLIVQFLTSLSSIFNTISANEHFSRKGIESQMRLSTEELSGGVTRVVLDGRLDIEGAQAVDLRMNVIAGSAHHLLVDLSGVTFLGSMGLRSLVVPAQAVRRRGGKTVFLNPTPMVEEVLRAANITSLVPVFHEIEPALAALA